MFVFFFNDFLISLSASLIDAYFLILIPFLSDYSSGQAHEGSDENRSVYKKQRGPSPFLRFEEHSILSRTPQGLWVKALCQSISPSRPNSQIGRIIGTLLYVFQYTGA